VERRFTPESDHKAGPIERAIGFAITGVQKPTQEETSRSFRPRRQPATTYMRAACRRDLAYARHRHARESWGERMVRTLEQSTMRKVYLRLLPFAVLSYILAYIDRINVSFAGLTMRGDLEMSAGTFGFAVGLFYWGYFIFEVPSNVILERVGARVWIARIMITWGILAGLTAMVTGSTSFAIVRFLLGVAEAGFFPGIIFYFTYWFPSHHHARIVSCFLIGLPVAVAVGRANINGGLLHSGKSARRAGGGQLRSLPAGDQDSSQSTQRRLALMRAELLPPYRPAAPHAEPVDTSTSHVGFRCIIRTGN
jgi:hypothetical protein